MFSVHERLQNGVTVGGLGQCTYMCIYIYIPAILYAWGKTNKTDNNIIIIIIINNNNHNNCQGETVTSRVLGVWIVRWVFLDEFHRLFVACSRTAKNPKIVPSQLKMPAYNMYVCIWLLRERGRERVTTVDTTFMIDIFGCIQINFLIQIHKKCCIPTVQFPLTH